MTTRKAIVTQIRTKAPAVPQAPDHETIHARANAASTELFRVARIMYTLRKVADREVIGEDSEDAIDGIGETLDVLIGIVESVASDVEAILHLAPEAAS